MRFCTALILCALSVVVSPVIASAQAYGTEAPFVLGMGARASAMGVAGVTLFGDATVQYYNPSALSTLQYKEFSFFRSKLFDSQATYSAFSYAHPLLTQGALGITLLRLDVGGIEERDANNQLLSADLSNAQTRLLLGYSRQITATASVGVNFKIDNQSFGSYSGSGVGLDVGMSAMQPGRFGRFITGFREGIVIHNLLEPSIKLDQESVADPMEIGVGVAALSAYGPATMVTTIDLVSPRYSPTTVRFGQEIKYAQRYALRFGLDRTTPTFGFGADYKGVTFDYAFREEDVGTNHRFALAVKFGHSVGERKAVERLRLEQAMNANLSDRMSALEASQIKSALAAGDSLFLRSAYESALGEYEKALLWDPQNERALEYAKRSRLQQLVEQGRRALAGENYVQALIYASEALEISPNDPTALAIAGRCKNQIAAAENSAELADEMLRKAIDMYANGDYTSALRGFTEVLRLRPDNRLAVEYADKSRANIDGIITREMSDGRRASRSGQLDTALSHFDRVLAIEPAHAQALAERDATLAALATLEAQAAAEAAPPAVGQAQPSVPRPLANPAVLEEKYATGMKHFDGGDFDQAAEAFFEVWKLDPSYHNVANFLTKAYLYMGMQYYTGRHYEDAIATWKRVLEIDPTNAKARRYLEKADEEFDKLRRASNE